MDYSDIGLDLFTAPFGGTPVAAPASRRETPKPQVKALVTQPKVSDSSVHQPNVTEKPAPEKKETESSSQYPNTEIKLPESVKPQSEAKAPRPKQSKTDAKASGQPQNPQAEMPDSAKPQPSTETQSQPEPPKELVLDMSDHTIPAGKPLDASENAKRKAHEEAEAKRKAEWEAKQAAKKQAEADAIQKLQSMSDTDIISASTERVRKDVERLTRRNMKDCVAEHIQSICRKDPAFARRTMHPKKSMIHCFKYINRMAKEYIKQEMEDNDIQPENGVYGGDVPDGLCYQWAEDYFNDMDAPEDKEKEEKFEPRPYVGTASKSTKKANSKKKAAKKEPEKKKEPKNSYEQMSFTEVL